MDNKTKDGYLVAAGFILVGLICLYSSWLKFDLVFYTGIGFAGLGAAGFRWPEVAEVLVHWAKKQEKSNTVSSRQTQKNTKNSNQVFTQSGDVHIHHHKK